MAMPVVSEEALLVLQFGQPQKARILNAFSKAYAKQECVSETSFPRNYSPISTIFRLFQELPSLLTIDGIPSAL